MPARLLVAAQALPLYEKGDIVSIVPGDFGSMEVLPNYIQMTISDAAPDAVRRYLSRWKLDFHHEIIAQNAAGWRVRISVDPELVSNLGVGSELKQSVRNHLTTAPTWEGTTVFAFDASSVTVDVPKGIPYWVVLGLTNNQQRVRLERELGDVLGDVVKQRRWAFSDAAVDAAIAAGGEITQTKAQAVAALQDKLDD